MPRAVKIYNPLPISDKIPGLLVNIFAFDGFAI